MTTAFYEWPYGRFIEIQGKLRRKKLHRTNQGSNFLEGSFGNRDNIRAPIQFRREKPNILKDDFSSTTEPSIFTSIAPELLDQSNKTKWVFISLKSTSHFLPKPPMSHRSVSCSKANSSCCHRSDAWSNLG